MYCPKCSLQNGDDVIYCRGCGSDLASVRTILDATDRRAASGTDLSVHFSDRQLRRMKRRGIEANAEPMSLASRAIDLQSGGLRTGMLAAGFAIVTAIIYSRPPVDGIFWLFWLIPTFIFFSISVSRFVQAGMIKKLLRETALPAALPDREPDYHQTGNREEQRQLWGSPPASIYETDELERPSRPGSVADATTRHLR